MDDYRAAWKKLRRQLERERRSYQVTGRNKDAKMTFAALEGAYGGVLRMMDRLEAAAAETRAQQIVAEAFDGVPVIVTGTSCLVPCPYCGLTGNHAGDCALGLMHSGKAYVVIATEVESPVTPRVAAMREP